MALRIVTCAHCGTDTPKETGAINRARRSGLLIYCDRKCAGLHRRNGKTTEQRKADKSEYDKRYRFDNLETRKIQKAAYHKRTYDPDKARIVRRARMPYHVQYCRNPEYRAKKHEYDRKRYANEFGLFAESHMLLMDIIEEVNSRASRQEIYQANGTINKKLKRRREYDKAYSREP